MTPPPHISNQPKYKLVEKETGETIETFRSKSQAIRYLYQNYAGYQRCDYELMTMGDDLLPPKKNTQV